MRFITIMPDSGRILFHIATATASAPTVLSVIGISFVECVSVYAMRFLGVLGLNSLTSQGVGLRRSDLDMSRVDTMSDSTQMVALHIRRDRLNEQLVDVSVGVAISAFDRNNSVSADFRQLPFPTRNSVMEMFGRDLYGRKDSSKKFGCDFRFGKLFGKHLLSPIQKVSVRLESWYKQLVQPLSFYHAFVPTPN